MDKKLKIQWLDEKPPIKERDPKLYYYDIRDGEGSGYSIERSVLANNIGSLVTNKDILGERDWLNDEELDNLHPEVVNNLVKNK